MISIQIPSFDSIDQIITLNGKYLIGHLTEEQKQNGFIRIKYERDDIQQIIVNKEIVVATTSNKIIGYYLIGRKSNTTFLSYQKEKVINLFGNDLDKVGYGAQAVIEKEYRGLDLLNRMLNTLIEQLQSKYQYLFSSVTKINTKAIDAHSKDGYKIIDEDEVLYYVALKLF